MENIIQQIAIEMVEKINKKAFSEKLTDLDKLAAEIFEDCTESAKLIVQEVVRIRNLQFREGAIDWSIFEGERAVMDVNSGTQVLLKRYGTDHGILSRNILS